MHPATPGKAGIYLQGQHKLPPGRNPLTLTNLQISKCQKEEEKKKERDPEDGICTGNNSIWAWHRRVLTTSLLKGTRGSGQQQSCWLQPRGIRPVKTPRAAGSSQLTWGPHSSLPGIPEKNKIGGRFPAPAGGLRLASPLVSVLGCHCFLPALRLSHMIIFYMVCPEICQYATF